MVPCIKSVIGIAFTLLQLIYVTGVRLKNVTIPHYGVKDGTVQLFCDFVLEDDSLLVLIWYKDEQEFFRYNPSTLPSIMTFNTSGVVVDTLRSNLNIVTLKNITLNTGGMYKCEVSVDRNFRTLAQDDQLHVIAPPLYEPEIFGVHPTAAVGNRLVGNCTSYRSKPAASLMFYVNDEKINPADTIEYSPINETDGLETSVLGFNFLLEPKHFVAHKMMLKCTATIGNSYWVRTQLVAETKANDAQLTFSGQQNRFLSGAASLRSHHTHTFGIPFSKRSESILQLVSNFVGYFTFLWLLIL